MKLGDEGFSLVELLVAMTVLAVGIFGTMQVFLGTMRTASVASARTRASALAAREVEAMRAVPYDALGFGLSSAAPPLFEGMTTVLVPDATARTTPSGAPEIAAGVTFSIARNIVWVSDAVYVQKYKRVTATVIWRDQSGGHSVRQDEFVYPGGRGPHAAGLTTTTSTTTPLIPGVPSLLVASRNALSPTSQIDLTWTPGVPLATTWEVQHSLDAGFVSATVDTTTQPGSIASYNKTGLAAGTAFYFRVRALAGAEQSAWSNTAIASTEAVAAPACVVGTTNATPAAVKKKNDATNRLTQDIYVSVQTTGTCSGLSLRFSPQAASVTEALIARSGGAWDRTIDKNAYGWDTGSETLQVVDGSQTVLATIALQICAANAATCP